MKSKKQPTPSISPTKSSSSSSEAHSPPSSMSKQINVENTLGCVTVLPRTSTRGGRTGYSWVSDSGDVCGRMPSAWGKWKVTNRDVSENRGTPKWMVYNGNPIKMDDLGVPLFSETSIYVQGFEIWLANIVWTHSFHFEITWNHIADQKPHCSSSMFFMSPTAIPNRMPPPKQHCERFWECFME